LSDHWTDPAEHDFIFKEKWFRYFSKILGKAWVYFSWI